jgi:phosphoglycolate phosphatase
MLWPIRKYSNLKKTEEQMDAEGAIFDLDGTLVNSLDDLADSMNHVLLKFNYPAHEASTYMSFVGNGIRNLVHVALPESARDEQTVSACHDLMMETYAANCIHKTKPYEGITDLLSALKSFNMRLAVLSNKTDTLTKIIVQSLLPGYFDVVMGLSTEAHKKPDPFGALQISNILGIRCNSIIFTGDSGIDMQTAVNAGMHGVGVLWGFRTREELRNNGAEHIIEHPLDLLAILLGN